MNGKIFKESSNVNQDQAKILFAYYQQAAEKIVNEEERLEKEIKILEEEKAVIDKTISGLWVWFLTIILFFVYFIKKSGLDKKKAEIDARIAELQKQHKEIFRDYKVSKLGVAYVPVAEQVKFDDRSFIVDYTGSVAESEVKLQLPKRNDLLIETIGKLEKQATEAPIVEASDNFEKVETDDYSISIQEVNRHDYIGGLERSLKTIGFCMNDLDTTEVTLPLVSDNSQQLDFLNEFATKDIPEEAHVINVFDRSKYSDSINKFQELNKLKDSLSNETQQFEDVLKSLMVTMANSVQAISNLKLASTDKVIFESNKLLMNILKSPYNHYSPTLEYEEIARIRNEKFDYTEDVQEYEPFNLRKSSMVKFNMLTGMWTSEDGDVTNMPFGVHQIYEEIVSPIVQNLMNENRVERLKIYNNIKDQKINYLNKWHQDTDAFYRANRAESSDIINIMQESLREYVASYNTLVSLKKTEESIARSNGDLNATIVSAVDNSSETLLAFEMQSKEFQKTQSDFEDYIERLKDDIEAKAEKFGHVEYYDARLRDGYSNEVAVAISEVHSLDERRKSLAEVSPLFAKTSELPPQPKVEEITFEHLSLNLPYIAQNALDELSAKEVAKEDVDADDYEEEETFVDETEDMDEYAENDIDDVETEDDEEEEYDEDEEDFDDEESDDEEEEEVDNEEENN